MKGKKKRKNVSKNTYVSRHGKKEKRIKIRYGRIIILLLFLFTFFYLIFTYIKIPIRNIFISGNTILKDQEIIDLADISDYPSILSISSYGIEKKLEKNIYVKKANVKKDFRQIYIEIKENYPLFYNQNTNKTIMYNFKETSIDMNAPVLINSLTSDVYKLFKEKMKLVNRNIISRISEIKYDPVSVDEERFLFTMNDGNYVYITLEKIEKINNYVDIIKTFENKKGILYLDSGEYFELFNNYQ